MRVIPIGDKVVVKRLEPEETTRGGIVLPDMAREKPRQGRVLSIGDGKLLPNGTRVHHEVSEGDRVLFRSYCGTEFHVEGQELLILSADDILAVLS